MWQQQAAAAAPASGAGARGGRRIRPPMPKMSDNCVKWSGRLCVTFVWSFCAAAYWAIWHFVFIPYMMYTVQNPAHIFILLIFHFLVVMCLYSYYCAIRSDPGFVKPGYLPPGIEDSASQQTLVIDLRETHEPQGLADEEIEMQSLASRNLVPKGKERIRHEEEEYEGISLESADPNQEKETLHREERDGDDIEVVEEKNFCKKCSSFRPARAHHCRHCGRCVLRMDHHCPWINNCVGHCNLKYFLLFLCYGACLGATYLTLFGFGLFDIFTHREKYTTNELWTTGTIMGVITWVGCAFTVNLAAMSLHTLNLIVKNTTSVERMTIRAQLFQRQRRGGKHKILKSRYDMGIPANLRQVLGSSPLQWFFPTAPDNDGYYSPVNPNPNNEFELV